MWTVSPEKGRHELESARYPHLFIIFTIPGYSNRGTRTYLTARYKVRRGIDVWLRWSQWYYNNVNVIGSGQNEIIGNTKTEIRAQVRFKF